MFEFARHISKLFFDSNSFLSYFIFFVSLFSMLKEPPIFHKEKIRCSIWTRFLDQFIYSFVKKEASLVRGTLLLV